MVCVFINTELDVQNSSSFQKQNGVVVFSEGPKLPQIQFDHRDQALNKMMAKIK